MQTKTWNLDTLENPVEMEKKQSRKRFAKQMMLGVAVSAAATLLIAAFENKSETDEDAEEN